MQPKPSTSMVIEAWIEAASSRLDRHVHDMLQDLEDDVRERDYEEQMHASRARDVVWCCDDL
jgi:hypothetical protein